MSEPRQAICPICQLPVNHPWQSDLHTYHTACLMKRHGIDQPPSQIPDHGNNIPWDEFSDLTHFQKHLAVAGKTVEGWPAWKRNILRDCGKAQWEHPRWVSACYGHGVKPPDERYKSYNYQVQAAGGPTIFNALHGGAK